jgi:nucleoid DNA-binding protein
MQKYNKDWLIREVASKADFTIGDVTIIIDKTIEIIKDIIAEKSELFISGLFTLSVGKIKAHDGVDPKTKLPRHVEESLRIKFKPSRALYDLLK